MNVTETNLRNNYFNELRGLLDNDILVGDEIAYEGYYEWPIENWGNLVEDKVYSPEFQLGDYKWKILLFPNGNTDNEYVSVFLVNLNVRATGADKRTHVCAKLVLSIRNYNDYSFYYAKFAHHRFNNTEDDWGFNRLIEKRNLFNQNRNNVRPIIENGKAVLSVYVRIFKDELGVLWNDLKNWDSKKETGYVGFKNQGATSYMNSLLQSLFFTNDFRRIVYQIPTENDRADNSIPFALQNLFYNLQNSDQPVDTKELSKAFGWNTSGTFNQNDIQEFNRILQNKLESKMKNTSAEGAISRLFKGIMKNYIQCINIPYNSTRIEEFSDIQLNVRGCKNLIESFDEYIKVETLEYDNQYLAEGHGLQDARKGIIFESLPPILHLQLKRFEYNLWSDSMIKINDRFEFPERVDLSKYLSEDADKNITYIYRLHSVLVHKSELQNGAEFQNGSYYAFIQPKMNGKWFKFDFDRVIPASKETVFEESFGSNDQMEDQTTNAYMLVYIRETEIPKILAPIQDSDIPSYISERIELKKIKKEKQQYYYMIYILDNDIINENNNRIDLFNINMNQYPKSHLKKYIYAKTDTVGSFKEMLAKVYNVKDKSSIRFWNMVRRQNRTIRPELPIDENDNMTLEKMFKPIKPLPNEMDEMGDVYTTYLIYVNYSVFAKNPRLKLTDESNCMVFLKYYDPITRNIEFVGNYIIDNNKKKFINMIPDFNEMKGFPRNTRLLLYEEIKPDMVEEIPINADSTTAEIGNGDIICFQKAVTPELEEQLNKDKWALVYIPEFIEFIRSKIIVTFKKRNGNEDEIKLELLDNMNYYEVARAFAHYIKLDDPMKLRFYVNNSNEYIEDKENFKLNQLNRNTSVIIYYEILDMTITMMKEL